MAGFSISILSRYYISLQKSKISLILFKTLFFNAKFAVQCKSIFPNRCTAIWQSLMSRPENSLQTNHKASLSICQTLNCWNICAVLPTTTNLPEQNLIKIDTKLYNKFGPFKIINWTYVIIFCLCIVNNWLFYLALTLSTVMGYAVCYVSLFYCFVKCKFSRITSI